ncbi:MULTISPECIES: NADP-dependent malic enzyme [Oligella]|uniref:NADP-dependent malic enzyme n=1 Tax=Oligella urethralis TaxID=90245 RepID=A0A2N6QFE1_9BURK|nr:MULTISPECIES: NADP-dependent malic enzyme [Oligella]AVL70432.1 NADP-dependent malic enzyme [Oligella urethralis]MDK6202264.1 NADP-dependent malic enzyme [Oligella urethralis]OFS83824.1 malate dehydrogenase [Oligella sp. HMSC05A10]OFV49383.1 malate dehydrogenase [Oligella sp. HMSC09E12]PMC18289.1 NADP-dependent malic enzyme [Oligella urethralis]
MDDTLREAALFYHRQGKPGKISVEPTKKLANQRDLALAYSPGVAAACDEIVKDAANASLYTARGNLVGVITNGTAVLGLGEIGALASKPVMEGKAVLFKKFAGIDCFDIEINEKDPEKLVEIIAGLEPTFGGINLEDIKAPECFIVEQKLRERMRIPVFHDDQHGTAICVAAAFINGLKVVDKAIDEVKLVVSGAGAAALACLDLLVDLGVPLENIWVSDIEGVVYKGRTLLMDEKKARYAQETSLRTLDQIIDGADVFLGLSAGGVLKQDMVKKMAAQPLILALANPNPEILPELAKEVRPDAVIATGRSDYPNQVNNVLCFPYIFRGALDVGAISITRNMEIACVHAICNLAQEEQNERVAAAYEVTEVSFGPEYLIPKPLDPRLITRIAPAVAKAAMEDGVATRPIADFDEYIGNLKEFVYHSGAFMRPLFTMARQFNIEQDKKSRIVFTEGEDERVLRAVQVLLDEKICAPILVGRPEVLAKRIKQYGLRIDLETQVEVVNPEMDDRYKVYWQSYWEMRKRAGVSQELARVEMRRRMTLIGAMLMHLGEADGMICGTVGTYTGHLQWIDQVLGMDENVSTYGALSLLILPERVIAIADTHVNPDPTPEEIAEITLMAAAELRHIKINPKVALLSSSDYGTDFPISGEKMRKALEIIRERDPALEIDGEMHGDMALNEALRKKRMPDSPLTGSANLVICPDMQSGNIAYNLLKSSVGSNVSIGPFLLGCKKPVHILTSSATVRRIINMTVLAVVDANTRAS